MPRLQPRLHVESQPPSPLTSLPLPRAGTLKPSSTSTTKCVHNGAQPHCCGAKLLPTMRRQWSIPVVLPTQMALMAKTSPSVVVSPASPVPIYGITNIPNTLEGTAALLGTLPPWCGSALLKWAVPLECAVDAISSLAVTILKETSSDTLIHRWDTMDRGQNAMQSKT